MSDAEKRAEKRLMEVIREADELAELQACTQKLDSIRALWVQIDELLAAGRGDEAVRAYRENYPRVDLTEAYDAVMADLALAEWGDAEATVQ